MQCNQTHPRGCNEIIGFDTTEYIIIRSLLSIDNTYW